MKKLILLLCLTASLSSISSLQGQTGPQHSESYRSFTFDGAWCWFSDPRAVYYKGKHERTYAGWIDSHGDVVIASYDHQTQEIQTQVLADNYQIDDHDNPALLFRPDGKLMVFFTKHSGPHPTLLYTMTKPEDINNWTRRELYLNDTEAYPGFNNSNTYVNPVMLSEENNRIYLFWRGIDFKPHYSFSDDMGVTWSKGRIFILPERTYFMRRPYVKVYSNGKDKIFFAFTDGHPRKEEDNSIYCMYYQGGDLYKVGGEKIGPLGEGEVTPAQASKVYDGKTGGAKAWIWDIALDEEENPILSYAKFPDDQNHHYVYARWDGNKWHNHELLNAGGWFPETPEGKEERESNYSGGIVIDHENPNVVYLSAKRDSVFEIEKWSTKNGGKKWTTEYITQGSEKDNIRPFAVRNATLEQGGPQVMWIQNTHYIHYTDYLSSVKMDVLSPKTTDALDPNQIRNLMRQTTDWQLANPFTRAHRLDWHWGAFYTGLVALYEETGEDRYLNEIKNLGQQYDWGILPDFFHADRLTIIDIFAWLYTQDPDPKYIERARWALDAHIGRRAKPDVRFKDNPYHLEWWTWCDALYMAPPSFARMYQATGEEKYLEYADKFWWLTSDYLYSEEDGMYFRDDRYFDKKTSNGKKVFWGRGNGWVVAGLARMLKILPKDHPSREKFETQFKQMCETLYKLQREDGLWTASLFDPEELPLGESSGSSFFTFAIASGINQGILDADRFGPVVRNSWKALSKNVNSWGRLGYVQQVAGDPYPFFDYQWQVYATGAFLLAGKEMIELVSK